MILSITLTFLSCFCVLSLATIPVADTKCGSIYGTWLDSYPGVASFLGIPYAQPPVEELRFMPPVQKCWSGNASSEAKWCWQPPVVANLSMSEDCLYLNVYTPAKFSNTSKLPVIVGIHGGSLIIGSSYWYANQANLVMLGQVVVVTINYRLGVFGWMALPDLATGDPRGVSGNYGFLDQQLALRWVKENIRYFGGDPNRVTLLGQSSGGTSIFGHLIAPESASFISSAIALSPSANISASLSDAYEQNKNFAESVNCSGDAVAECLRSLPAEALNNAIPTAWNFIPFGYPFPSDVVSNGEQYPALIIVDGVTITQSFASAMVSGTALDIPLIISGMNNELTLYMPLLGISFSNLTQQQLQSSFVKELGEEDGTAIWKAYTDVWENETNDLLMSQMSADFGVACGLAQIGASVPLSRKSPVYVTLVTTPPSTPPPNPFLPSVSILGSPHTWDFVVGCADWRFYCYWGHVQFNCTWMPSERDVALGDTIRTMWFDLVHYGKLIQGTCEPANGHSLSSLPWCLPLSSGATSSPGFRSPKCEVWSNAGFGEGEWWCD